MIKDVLKKIRNRQKSPLLGASLLGLPGVLSKQLPSASTRLLEHGSRILAFARSGMTALWGRSRNKFGMTKVQFGMTAEKALKQVQGDTRRKVVPTRLLAMTGKVLKQVPGDTRRKALPILVGVLIIMVPVLIFVPRLFTKAQASWYDDNFAYRQTVAVSNAGSAQTNYQIPVSLDTATLITAGKMQSTCNDIRVTDYNGKTLPLWIETGTNACNTTTTKIWVKVPSVPTPQNVLLLYYGNPGAPSVSDGSKVFEFFDDFANGTSPDSAKWSTTGSPTLSGGAAVLTNGAKMVSTATTTDSSGLGRLIARVKQGATTLTGGKVGFSNTNTLATNFHNDDAITVNLGSTQEQVAQTASTNLVSHHLLEETTTTDANQFKASGYLDTGKLSQAVSVYGNAAGTTGSTLTFNSGAQISGNNYERFNTNQGSISFWIKPSWAYNDGLTHGLFYGAVDSNNLIYIYKASDNRTIFGIKVGGTWHFVDNTYNLQSGTWYHLTMTWDADNAISSTHYIEATINNSASGMGYTSATTFTPFAPPTTLYVGGSSQSAQALIDDFAIFDRVLTTTEITNIYNSGTGREAGYVADSALKFYAKMDGSGTLSPVTYNGGASASKTTATSSELTGGTSLITDGNMEAGNVTSWPAYNTPTTREKATTGVYADTQSLHLITDVTQEGARQTYTLSANTNYSFSAWVKPVTGTWRFDWVDSSETYSRVCLQDIAQTSTWTYVNCAFKTDAALTSYKLTVQGISAGANEAYVDNISLTPNLVDNGGMESAGAGGADIWGGWSETASDGTLANETSIIHSGSNAAKITTGATTGGSGPHITQNFTVVAGNTYLWSVWTRGDGTNSGRYYGWNSTLGSQLLAQTSWAVTGTTYSRANLVFTIPTGTTSIQLQLFGPSVNGSYAYFDDISLIPLDNTALSFQSWTPVQDTPGANSTELLSNTGFETAGAGGADVFGSWIEYGPGTVADETSIIHNGSHSIKMITDGTWGTRVTQNITVVPGKTYIYSFWTKGDGTHSGWYQIYDNTHSTDIVTASAGVTGTTFQQVNYYVTIPAGATLLTVYFHAGQNGVAGTSYFDDGSFKEAPNPLSVQGDSDGVTSTTSGARGNGYTFDGSTGYLRQKTYDVNIGTLTYADTNTDISDTGQEFEDWDNDDAGSAEYMVVVTNSDNTTSWGYFCANDGGTQTAVYTLKACTGGSEGFNGTSPSGKTPVGYEVRKTDFQVTGALTLGAWVKTTDQQGYVLNKQEIDGFSYAIMTYTDGARLELSQDGTSTRISISSGAGTITDNNWHYVVGTTNGSNSHNLYVDGVLKATSTQSLTSIADTAMPLLVGTYTRANCNWCFTGSIDSPFVISSALTASQIQDIYNSSASHYGLVTNNATANSLDSSGSPQNDTSYHTYVLSSLSTGASSTLTQETTSIGSVASSGNVPNSAQYLRLQNADATNALTVDWVAVAKQASTAPTVSAPATEEKGGAPVAYWKFDDGTGTNAQDSSPNGNDGTITGATWQTEDMCVSGKCLKYSGSDYVNAGNNSSTQITTSLTLEGWYKSNTATSDDIVSKFNDSTNNRSYRLYIASNGVFRFMISSNGTDQIYRTTTQAASANTWYHVAGVYDSSAQTMKVYINGKEDTGTLTGTVPTSIYNTSESVLVGGFDGVGSMNGFLDDVKIYNYARTAAQVKTDFASRGTSKGTSAKVDSRLRGNDSAGAALSSGLVGYWKMDEAAANGCTGGVNDSCDSSGNANNGAWNGDATSTAGKFGNGVTFDGTGDYVESPYASSLKLGNDGTISLWFKPTSLNSGTHALITYGALADYSRGYLLNQSGTSLALYWAQSGGGSSFNVSNFFSSTGIWYHITLTNRNGNLTAFRDGTIVGTGTSGGSITNNYVTDIGGVSGGWDNTSGTIDDVRIYNRALSPAEVRVLYNWNPTPAAQYKLDEGSGITANDTSANGNTATSQAQILNSNATALTWAPAKYGKGVTFNGIDQYLSAADSTSLDQTAGLSLSGFVKPTAVGTNIPGGTVVSKGKNYNLSVEGSVIPGLTRDPGSRVAFSTNAITTALSGTAINDVYFYDTTKDTNYGDGSANDPLVWRFNSAKSWYSETIDATYSACNVATNDRCGNKEFPEKSYIVATASNVYIFDAQENAMWMRFDKGGSVGGNNINMAGHGTGSFSSTFALDGRVYIARPNYDGSEQYGGAYKVNFVSDNSIGYSTSTASTTVKGTYNGNISQRNSNSSYNGTVIVNIVNAYVNDIHAAVISGSTYVAVATDGGVSVINETAGTVVNGNGGGAGDVTRKLWLTSGGDLYSAFGSTPNVLGVVYDVNTKVTTFSQQANKTYIGYGGGSVPALCNASCNISAIFATSGTSTVDGTSNTIYVATALGTTVIQEKQGDEANGSVKYFTKDYITEEMVGDIRGMWPLSAADQSATTADASVKGDTLTSVAMTSSSDVTGVRGSGLSFNGSTQYLKQTPKTSYDSSNVDSETAYNLGGGYLYRAQQVTLSANQTVGTVRLWLRKVITDANLGGSVTVQIRSNNAGGCAGADCPGSVVTNGTSTAVNASSISGTAGWVGFKFATDPTIQTNYWIVINGASLTNNDAGDTISWGSDASSATYGKLRDYSVDGTTWNVPGTTSVAHSFELYNNNFDITGNLTVGAWVKNNSFGAGYQGIIGKGAYDDTWCAKGYRLTYNGSVFILDRGCASMVTGTTQPSNSTWYFVVAVVNGSNAYIYVNGVLEGSGGSAVLYDTAGTLEIGTRGTDGGDKWNGTIDEPFVTASALTADEIKRMYEVGKRAVTAGGTSALNGSSNQVNAVVAGGLSAVIPTSAPGSRRVTTSRLFAGTQGGGVSEIDLNSDTLVTSYTNATTPAINSATVTSLTYTSGGSFIAGMDSGVSRLNSVSGRSSPSTTSWTSVSGEFDKTSGYYNLYENGVKTGSVSVGTGHSPVANSTVLSVGAVIASGSVAIQPFYGSLDQVEVWSYGFTNRGAVTAMNAGQQTVGSPVGHAVGYWKFDEGQGPKASSSVWNSAGSTTNLVTNPSFETNLTSWTAASGTLTQDSTKANWGSTSAKFTGTAGNYFYGGAWSVTAGATYTASTFYQQTASGYAQMALRWRASDHSTISTDYFNLTTGNVTSWMKASGTASAPASATEVLIMFLTDFEGGSFTYYIDGVQLTQTSSALPYCDGSLTGNGTHSWSGTAHASTSTCTYGQDGEINGATWTQSGKFGKALSFDGTNDYINMGDVNAFDGLTDMSYSFWAKKTSTASTGYVLSKSYLNFAFLIQGNDSDAVAYFANGSGSYTGVGLTHTGTTTTNWNHYTVTKSGTTVSYYVNGIRKYSATASIPTTLPSNSLAFVIGADSQGGVNSFFPGLIDEVKIYNYALTSDEVKTDYNRGQVLALGSLGSNSSYAAGANNQTYCIPGDSTSCSAPVGEWNFEEGSGGSVYDSSGNSNTGTWAGTGTHYAPGKYGKGGKFVSDNVEISDSSSLDMTTAVTVEAWIKPGINYPTSPSAWHEIVTKYYANEATYGISYEDWESGKLMFEIKDGATQYQAKIIIALTAGQWYHVLGTYDGLNVKLYVNGVLQATTAHTGSITPDNNVLRMGLATSGRQFNGLIDNVKIFNYARTAAQVAWDYNRGGPVGWWKMNECQGVTLFDASGKGNNGTITIGASGTQAAVGDCSTSATTAWYTGRTGKYNSSLNFDGTDDYVEAADNNIFDPTNLSVSIWLKPSNLSGTYDLVSHGDNTAGWYIETNGSTKVRLCVVGSCKTMSTGFLTAGAWNHLVVIHDGTNDKFYVNGVLTDTIAQTTAITDYSGVFRIARWSNGAYYFPGQIDDVRIYNYALTSTQVKTLYNENASVRFGPSTGTP